MDANIYKPKSHTTFEYLALLIVLMVWTDAFTQSGFAGLGDYVVVFLLRLVQGKEALA